MKVLKWDIITTVIGVSLQIIYEIIKQIASLSWILSTVCGKNSLYWIMKTDLMEILLPLDILYIQLVVNVTINFGCDLITEICSQWQKNARKYRENFYIDKSWFLKSLFWICIINIVLALMLVRISWFECLFLNFIPFFDFLDLPKVFYFWQKENKTRFHSYQLECCWYFTSWCLELNARSLPFWVHSLHHHSPGNAWYWWSILSINNKYFLFMNYIVI